MIIRDATQNDAQQLDRLLTALIQDEAAYDGNLEPNCVVVDNYCQRIGLDGHKLILIEDHGEILGYLYGFIYSIAGIYRSPIAIVDALFITQSHRRKGYATRLLHTFAQFAKEHGAGQIELKVLSNNQPAYALYRKLSFTETKKYMMLDLSSHK